MIKNAPTTSFLNKDGTKVAGTMEGKMQKGPPVFYLSIIGTFLFETVQYVHMLLCCISISMLIFIGSPLHGSVWTSFYCQLSHTYHTKTS